MAAPATLTVPPSAPSAKPSFYRPELDILRFFAFLAVFITHIALQPIDFFTRHHSSPWMEAIWTSTTSAGAFGVDLFFVLSAYLITELLLRERDERGSLNVKAFYVRRILRIWPLYYFFVFLSIALPFFNPQHAFGPKLFVPFLLLMGNWGLVAFGWPASAATPLWSVSVEEQFYLLWPPIVARLSRRQIVFAALCMVLIANLARIVALLLHCTAPQLWGNTFAHLDSIAGGILLAILLRGDVPKIGLLARIALITACVGCLVLRAYFQSVLPRDALGWGETLLGWPVVAAGCSTILYAFLGFNIKVTSLQYLGKISYGLYVYHLLSIMIVDKLLPAWQGISHFGARIVLSLAITVLLSSISYAFLEKPFLKLKCRFTYVQSRPV